MTVYAITDTKKGEQGLRLLIFKLPQLPNFRSKIFVRTYIHDLGNIGCPLRKVNDTRVVTVSPCCSGVWHRAMLCTVRICCHKLFVSLSVCVRQRPLLLCQNGKTYPQTFSTVG